MSRVTLQDGAGRADVLGPRVGRRSCWRSPSGCLASPGVNREQKNDRDAAAWVPDRNQCWFADRAVRVRQKCNLTIDRREANALDQVLVSCASTALVRDGAPVPAPSILAGGQIRYLLRSFNGTITVTVGSPARKLARTVLPRCIVIIQPILSCEMATVMASCVSREAQRPGPDAGILRALSLIEE